MANTNIANSCVGQVESTQYNKTIFGILQHWHALTISSLSAIRFGPIVHQTINEGLD